MLRPNTTETHARFHPLRNAVTWPHAGRPDASGTQGLIPRATELLRLGFGFFLPFLPFVVAFSVLFTLTFYVFGADFLHGGGYYDLSPADKQSAAASYRPRSDSPPAEKRRAPAYIVPEALLAEPTVDRMVPFRPEQPAQ